MKKSILTLAICAGLTSFGAFAGDQFAPALQDWNNNHQAGAYKRIVLIANDYSNGNGSEQTQARQWLRDHSIDQNQAHPFTAAQKTEIMQAGHAMRVSTFPTPVAQPVPQHLVQAVPQPIAHAAQAAPAKPKPAILEGTQFSKSVLKPIVLRPASPGESERLNARALRMLPKLASTVHTPRPATSQEHSSVQHTTVSEFTAVAVVNIEPAPASPVANTPAKSTPASTAAAKAAAAAAAKAALNTPAAKAAAAAAKTTTTASTPVAKAAATTAAAKAAAAAAAANTPVANTPVANTPVANTPVANTPVANTPVANTPVANTPVANTPVANTPVANTPVANTPVANTPVANTPVANTPVANTPVANTPVANTPVANTPAANAPSGTTVLTPVAKPSLPSFTGNAKPLQPNPVASTTGTRTSAVPAATPSATPAAIPLKATQTPMVASSQLTPGLANSSTNQAVQSNSQALQQLAASDNQRFANLDKRIDKLQKRADAGVAGIAAMANIPMVAGHDFTVGAGVGARGDEQAAAVGVKFKVSENAAVSAGIAADTENKWTLGAGVGFGF